jgi:transcriptional regulator with XRE-family HTH domain
MYDICSMIKEGNTSTLSERAAANIRRERIARGWTGMRFAEECTAVGASLEPPLVSTLNNNRISKLEIGEATRMTVDELYLAATALGLSMDALLEMPQYEAPSLPSRVAALERETAVMRQALEGAGILAPGEGLQ